MARKPLDQIEFRKGTTIGKIKVMMDYHLTEDLAEEIYERFVERFLTPLKSVAQPHGFFTIAVCCLMIEAIQRYRDGHKNEMDGEKEDLYGNFFQDFPKFGVNRTQGKRLYHSLRSGVLHLGETKGWLIVRKGNFVVDFADKVINATRFLRALEDALAEYRDKLKRKKWDSVEWKRAVNRLKGYLEYSDLNHGD